MPITYHNNIIQGSEEWHQIRCGVLTASEMKRVLTPTLKVAKNDKTRDHVLELAAQRISQYVEPFYVGDDMLRGNEDEIYARMAYKDNYGDVEECGFITNDEWGFKLGYSPDGLVGDDGLIECKSRRQKFQIETTIDFYVHKIMPEDHILQVQTGLLVSKRKWCDYISYCGGLHMATFRVFPDQKIQDAIIEAATVFEKQVAEKIALYSEALRQYPLLIPTERRIIEEITI